MTIAYQSLHHAGRLVPQGGGGGSGAGLDNMFGFVIAAGERFDTMDFDHAGATCC